MRHNGRWPVVNAAFRNFRLHCNNYPEGNIVSTRAKYAAIYFLRSYELVQQLETVGIVSTAAFIFICFGITLFELNARAAFPSSVDERNIEMGDNLYNGRERIEPLNYGNKRRFGHSKTHRVARVSGKLDNLRRFRSFGHSVYFYRYNIRDRLLFSDMGL